MYRSKSRKPRDRVTDLPPTGIKVWPDSAPCSDEQKAKEPWRSKQRRTTIGLPDHRVVTIGQLLAGCGLVWSALLVLFLAWWKPSWGLTSGASSLGLLGGLMYSYLYYRNCKHKLERQQVLSMDPGLKGCQYLLGTLPTWISLTEREKMEWFNRLLAEMWPYYDRGICKLVKEIVEPIIESYRPPIFKRIFFQELTFGEAPFRVEGIAVRDSPDEIDMEIDVRWCGDANISLGIELPVGGEYTRVNPKVKDIVFVATLKVILKPLVEQIPGFAAAAVALKAPPIIKYRLDFGVLPAGASTLITAPVLSFVDMIVNQVIVGQLLWPNRFTVPLLSSDGWMPAYDPTIDLEVERLNGRQQGIIKVHIIQAKELKSYDTLTGKSDPFVEIFTTQDHREKTRVISNSLSPQWNEVKYLPVIEKDTVLRVEVFDYDAVNISSFASLRDSAMLKGSKDFMGRCAVPLAQFIKEEGVEQEIWLPLGKGDWTNLGGPGHGEGQIRLGLQYRDLESIAGEEVSKAEKGLVLVGVIRCYDLGSHKPSSYVKVKLTGGKDASKDTFKTSTIAKNANPRWSQQNKFTLDDAKRTDSLLVTVYEPDFGADNELGSCTVPVSDIIASCQVSRWTEEEQVGYMYEQFKLAGSSTGRIELELEFLPYW